MSYSNDAQPAARSAGREKLDSFFSASGSAVEPARAANNHERYVARRKPLDNDQPPYYTTQSGKPCRACTDFRSYTSQATGFRYSADDEYSSKSARRPKLATTTEVPSKTDEQSYTARLSTKTTTSGAEEAVLVNADTSAQDRCPLDSRELGQRTWAFLHTMAAYYPDKPTSQQENDMSTFFRTFSQFYPCEHCADDLRRDLQQSPVQASSRHALSQWLCQMHNRVNTKLDKPEFDCRRVDERWRDGWRDSSCGFYYGGDTKK